MAKPVALIIDDEPDLASLFTELFGIYGWTAIGISAPMRADTVTTVGGPDIILIDIMLAGGQSGIEVATGLRQSTSAKLVALSVSEQMLRAARDSGVFDLVLDKSMQTVEIVRACTGLLGESL